MEHRINITEIGDQTAGKFLLYETGIPGVHIVTPEEEVRESILKNINSEPLPKLGDI